MKNLKLEFVKKSFHQNSGNIHAPNQCMVDWCRESDFSGLQSFNFFENELEVLEGKTFRSESLKTEESDATERKSSISKEGSSEG